MKTFDGYKKRTLTDSNLLLASGGDKPLSDFIGTLNWDSTNRKLQYKKIGDTSWNDLVTFGSNALNSTAYFPDLSTYRWTSEFNSPTGWVRIAQTKRWDASGIFFVKNDNAGGVAIFLVSTNWGCNPNISLLAYSKYSNRSYWTHTKARIVYTTLLQDVRNSAVIEIYCGNYHSTKTHVLFIGQGFESITPIAGSIPEGYSNIELVFDVNKFISGGFKINGLANPENYLLSANGSYITKSTYALATDCVNSIGTSGDTLTWIKNGIAQIAITVPYATKAGNADTLDNFHETSFMRNRGRAKKSNTLWNSIGILGFGLNDGATPYKPDGLSSRDSYYWGLVITFPSDTSILELWSNCYSSGSNNHSGIYYRTGWGSRANQLGWLELLDSKNYTAYINSTNFPVLGYTVYHTGNKPTKTDVGLGNVENIALSTWSGSSYLTTCNQGTFGSIITKSTSDYLPTDDNSYWKNYYGAKAGSDVWLRIASSGGSLSPATGLFILRQGNNGSSIIFTASQLWGKTPCLAILAGSYWSGSGPSKIRMVYHTTYSGHVAHIEVLMPNTGDSDVSVMYVGRGWNKITITTGEIPSGYTSKEMSVVYNAIKADSLIKEGSSDEYFLLGGGGSVAKSNYLTIAGGTVTNLYCNLLLGVNAYTGYGSGSWSAWYNGNTGYLNAGNILASSFKGDLIGNVTGNVSGSSGSCTGNSATATKLNQGSGANDDACMPSEGSQFQVFKTSAASGTRGGADGHIMAFTWSGASVYGAQIYIDTDPTNTMCVRTRNASGVWTAWNTVSYNGHTHSYLPLSGGTITGNLYVNLFLGVNAWSGYGSGTALAWYNGNTAHLVWDKSQEAPAFYSSSDIRLKNNINNISKSIRSFTWKESGLKSYGLIAQEIENEYPELVSNNDNGYKSINYTSALCMIIAKLENELDELRERINLLQTPPLHLIRKLHKAEALLNRLYKLTSNKLAA